jgi:hypothetical protein
MSLMLLVWPSKINVTNQQPMLLLNNQYWATTFKSTLQLSTLKHATMNIEKLQQRQIFVL